MPGLLQKIDAITLEHLARELRGMLLGARVSRITHPTAKEFLITFWGHARHPDLQENEALIPRGDLNHFYINLHPEFCYALLLEPGEKDTLVKTTLDHPTAVCMLLRKHLGNATVLDVATLPYERVLNLTFENFNELGNRARLVLSIELMGKTSNMLLYDEVQGEILALSHSVSEKMSQYREMTVGSPYAPPPLTGGKRPITRFDEAAFFALLQATPLPDEKNAVDDLINHMLSHISGFGKIILRQSIDSTQADVIENNRGNIRINPVFAAQLYRVLSALYDPCAIAPMLLFNILPEKFLPESLLPDEFSLVNPLINPKLSQAMPGKRKSCTGVLAMLREYYLGRTRAQRLQEYRQRLLLLTQNAERRRAKREQSFSCDAPDIETLQHAGHLLLAVANDGALEGAYPAKGLVEVPDYHSDRSVMLEVDPTLSWVENAHQYYRRAKKAKARQAQFDLQKEQLAQEQACLAEIALMIAQADSLKHLQVIESELESFLQSKKAPRKSETPAKSDRKHSAKTSGKTSRQKPAGKKALNKPVPGLTTLWLKGDGNDAEKKNTEQNDVQILLGRSGQANGELVGRLGRPDDWWFHVHQMPGSHVLLKASELLEEHLLLAANLAVYFSAARESRNVPVVYTQLKHVRKIPGSYPGHVTYKHERSVFITVDDALVQSVLEQQ